jgi:PadR family transcriptional regulator PadR
MRKRERDLYQGTLDLMVLKALLWGARHGYEVLRWIRRTTDGELEIEEGALYPSLHRLEARGWVTSEWGVSESGRQARYYTLTAAGREELEAEAATWRRYVTAMAKIMEAV